MSNKYLSFLALSIIHIDIILTLLCMFIYTKSENYISSYHFTNFNQSADRDWSGELTYFHTLPVDLVSHMDDYAQLSVLRNHKSIVYFEHSTICDHGSLI